MLEHTGLMVEIYRAYAIGASAYVNRKFIWLFRPTEKAFE
jgi:hypothetical protein